MISEIRAKAIDTAAQLFALAIANGQPANVDTLLAIARKIEAYLLGGNE